MQLAFGVEAVRADARDQHKPFALLPALQRPHMRNVFEWHEKLAFSTRLNV